jgi:hypothetical protein
MAFQEPSYMGDFAKLLDEGLNLQKQKKQMELQKGELEKKITILATIIPNKEKIDNTKIMKSMEYFTEQIEFKKKKTEEFLSAKERYIEHLENERERKLQEIQNKMIEVRAYYEAQINRSREAVYKMREETERYIDICNSKCHTNELKLLDTDKAPALQKLETERELLKLQMEELEAKISRNINDQEEIKKLW